MSYKSNLADIEVLFCCQTEKAISVWPDETKMKDEPIFLPKSMCEFTKHNGRGSVITLTANASLLEEKGLV